MNDLTNLHSVTSADKQRIIFLILPEVHLLDLAGPVQVFDTAASFGAPYSLHFCSSNAQVQSAQGLFLAQLEPLLTVCSGDLVIVAGVKVTSSQLDKPLLDLGTRRWLIDAHTAGVHIASVCAGAVALGEVGLLDGRRCTTHWSLVEALQQRHPAARLLEAVLYVHDRSVTTSAGIASGIDMALSLVEQHYGPRLAAEVARWMVIYLRRNGSQNQSSAYLEHRAHLYPAVHQVQDWLAEHVAEPVLLADLAAVAKMSVRSFSRTFKDATGLTPLQYQQCLRLEVAATLLADSDLPIEVVAARCGFKDGRHFRRLWHRRFGIPPSQTRQQQSYLPLASLRKIPNRSRRA